MPRIFHEWHYMNDLYIHLDFTETCCKSTLMYIADTIEEEDGYHLTNILSCDNNNFTEKMKAEAKDGKESLLEFFESKGFQLKWIELKEALLSLDMGSIVDHIQTKILYSQGKN